jgi:glutamyl/glutaminyl-tRNA synthetase
MTEEEIESVRTLQEKSKTSPGIYGNYSVWRNKTPDELITQIKENPNFIIRFRSP